MIGVAVGAAACCCRAGRCQKADGEAASAKLDTLTMHIMSASGRHLKGLYTRYLPWAGGSGSGHGDPAYGNNGFGGNAFTYGKLFHLLIGNCFIK